MDFAKRVDALERLNNLRATGALTADEYLVEKQSLIGEDMRADHSGSAGAVEGSPEPEVSLPLYKLLGWIVAVGGCAFVVLSIFVLLGFDRPEESPVKSSFGVQGTADPAPSATDSGPATQAVIEQVGYVRLSCEHRHGSPRVHLAVCKGWRGKVTIEEAGALATYGLAGDSDPYNIDRLYERFPNQGTPPALLIPVHLNSYLVQAQGDASSDTDYRFVIEVLDDLKRPLSVRKSFGLAVACAGPQYDAQCRLSQNASVGRGAAIGPSGVRDEPPEARDGINGVQACGNIINIKDGAYVLPTWMETPDRSDDPC